MIEYIAAVVSFLMPFYLASMIYELLVRKKYDVISIGKVIVCTLLISGAYLYLQPKQRLIAAGLAIVLAISLTIAILFGKLFKK